MRLKWGVGALGEWMLLAAAILSQSGGSSEPLKPSGAWSIDYGDDACTLSRGFGSGEITFGLRREMLDREGGVAVLTLPETRPSRSREFKGSFLFGNGEPAVVNATSRPLPENNARVITAYLDEKRVSLLAAGATFAFPTARNEHLWLATGNLDDAMTALSKCSDDLVTSLGIPLDELDAMAEPPKASGMIDLSPQRPWSVEGADWQIRTTILFEIDRQGKRSACRVLAYDGPEAFRNAACDRPVSVRFQPARNAAGEPIRSWMMLRSTTAPCEARRLRSGEMTC